MIESLKIKNTALLRNEKINFVSGFNVLLGETGAGKSIILDALNFVLGAKADKELITYGEDEMKVEAVFSNYSDEVKDELKNLDIEDEELLIITRSLSQAGKSEIRVNGNSLTLTMLKNLTKFLVDSYSQHENLILLKPKNHLNILDSYNPDLLTQEKEELGALLERLKEINKQMQSLGGDSENRERLLSLLKFQIDEINALNPSEKEEEYLKESILKMSNASKIANNLIDAVKSLDEGQFSSLTALKSAIRALNQIETFSSEYASLNERLQNAMYEIDDVASTLKQEAQEVYFDENEFDRLDAKLDKYKLIKKKYGNTVEDVLKFLKKTETEYDNLLNAEQNLAKLKKQKDEVLLKSAKVCAILSQKRKILAKELEGKIKAELHELGMKNVEFITQFTKKETFDVQGDEDVEFLFSANAGVEVKPLSKIISGGEMSRLSLALKNIIKGKNACLVFDEIDSGISGVIGGAVATRIAKIAKDNQVICISHSAQVCAMADKFLFVKKNVADNQTTTTVKPLEEEEIVYELAKMIDGKTISQTSLEFAKQLYFNSKGQKEKF